MAALYLNTAFKPTILLNIYTPPNLKERIHFFDELVNVIDTLPKRYNMIILGDFNTKIGKDEMYIKNKTIGNFTMISPNRSDSLSLLELCKNNGLKIENTFFKHKNQHIYTFYRNNYSSQIDFILSNIHSWFFDVKAMTTINISDHKMVVGCLMIKSDLWRNKNTRCNATDRLPRQLDFKDNFNHLKLPLVKDAISTRLSLNIQQFLQSNQNSTLEKCWSDFKCILLSTCKDFTNIRGPPVSDWVSPITASKIAELKSKSHRDKDLWKQIQRLLRSDRRKYVAEKAKKIEVDMKCNKLYDAYKKLKLFCKSSNFRSLPKLKINNNIICDPEEQMKLWLDHYSYMFNSEHLVSFTECDQIPPSSNFTTGEIKRAILKLRNNKATGLDNIKAEHLKVSPDYISVFLLMVFNKIWASGVTPREWNLSFICNFP
ncbi:uncharacterized protein LOC135930855 [Gordionus sp. m RMFG-2023]|uniref:uncharacterized protein LOC135930855 n=1 Tax=Gordionus sp. m RMFG-2023 TaxID=3053472 RepID=UPI0031FBC4E7